MSLHCLDGAIFLETYYWNEKKDTAPQLFVVGQKEKNANFER
jgi:hypothetical protein